MALTLELELVLKLELIFSLGQSLILTLDLGPAVELLGVFRFASGLTPKLEQDGILKLGPPLEFTLDIGIEIGIISGRENAAVREQIFRFFSRNSM